jgi:predicted Fe-Mo cluster-binding NifX family protein
MTRMPVEGPVTFMKICIPMEGESIAQDFDRTTRFLLVTLEDGKIVSRKLFISQRHESEMLPEILSGHSVTHIIGGSIGRKSRQMFENKNINVICGISGNLYEAIQALIDGKLVSNENLCSH